MNKSITLKWTSEMSTLNKLIVLFVILSGSIGAKGQDRPHGPNETSRINIALSFINDYVKHCDNRESASKTMTWIEDNKMLTQYFKRTYKDLIDDARKQAPELGLGFDPIFDAQDYPDKGFEFLKTDGADYVTVSGKDWPAFTTVIRVILIGDKWMVDGAGVINIPQDKQ